MVDRLYCVKAHIESGFWSQVTMTFRIHKILHNIPQSNLSDCYTSSPPNFLLSYCYSTGEFNDLDECS